MELNIYQIDAFSSAVLKGNPAAVILLDKWLPDDVLQAIANENNLSETVYVVKNEDRFNIRWFTPLSEVELCGHATLAVAFVLFHELGYPHDVIYFDSLSGELKVEKLGDWLELDFPVQAPVECESPLNLLKAFAEKPKVCLKAKDYIVVFESERQIIQAKPNYSLLTDLGLRGVAITAQSQSCDFITRFFAPKYGINEDPVTGSAFTQLAPYWASVMKKQQFSAKQVSSRGGEVKCRLQGDRVKIAGQAVKYMQGKIYLET